MTPNEHAAFNAGIRHAASLAQIAAVTIEVRDDASRLSLRSAATALHGLAEGLKEAAGSNNPSSRGSVPVHSPQPVANRTAAIAQGFTGDTCDACGSSEMKRGGTCLTCQSCGSTTGCG